MNTDFLVFPRISRFFAADTFRPLIEALLMLSHLSFMAVFILLFIGVSTGRILNPTPPLITQVLKKPFVPQPHINLAQILTSTKEPRHRELTLAEQLLQTDSSSQNVLGASIETVRSLQRESERHKKAIAFWEDVVNSKPDYRDGYLYLALSYLEAQHPDIAREYVAKAEALDPTFEGVRILKEALAE